MPGTRKLGRTSDHRMAMLRGLVTYLFEHGRIETTVTRAKEVRAMAEKYLTIAKHTDLANKRRVFSFITKEDVAKKLIDEIAPQYADRKGGYTRIFRLGPRRGDAAELAILSLLNAEPPKEEASAAKTTTAGDRSARVKKSKESEVHANEETVSE